MKIKLLTSMCIDGEHHAAGEVIDIPAEDARYIVGSNRAAPHADKPAGKARPGPAAAADND